MLMASLLIGSGEEMLARTEVDALRKHCPFAPDGHG
jgi:hypothetical protein